ncbi:MAG: GspE/PulE family protein [Rhodothermales bacterium]
MTGKDFFGKLLTNQEDEHASRDRRGSPAFSDQRPSDDRHSDERQPDQLQPDERGSPSHDGRRMDVPPDREGTSDDIAKSRFEDDAASDRPSYVERPVTDLSTKPTSTEPTSTASLAAESSSAESSPSPSTPEPSSVSADEADRKSPLDGFEMSVDSSALREAGFDAPSGDGVGSGVPDVQPADGPDRMTARPETPAQPERAEPDPSEPSQDGLHARSESVTEPSETDRTTHTDHADRTDHTDPPDHPDGPDQIDPPDRDGTLSGIRDRVVLRLLDKRLVTAEQVKIALGNREKENLKATLWRIVAQNPTVDREQVYREAALTYAFVERDLEENAVDLDFVRQVADVFPEKKRNRLIELRIVPIGYEFEQQTQMLRVVFITHDPSLPAVRELMQDLNLERYELQYADESKVKDLLLRAFPKKNEYLERMTEDPLAYDLGTSYEDEKSELIDEEALEAEINRSSLINLFEAALVEAVHRGASDIHIYPNARRQIEIHFRVDGRLSLWHLEDKVHPESLLAVIKDNTMNVDRFERDMAQDGFIQRKVDEALIRFRVSILPIATASNNLHAESIVIRVLDDRKVITDLSKLGLLEGALERFDMAIRQPHGMVILTGPTGSGKSTTLVAALHQVVTPEVNVLTVEDPVEYIIPNVRQIKLNHKLGLEGAIRAILRHDPDVVMVGEMRDRATAELAVKLANTGHLTFSTLHTNDAPSAVSRLYKMGVEPFLIAYAINLVVAQRLLRTLCESCKVIDNDPDPVLLKRLGFTEADLHEHTIYMPSGDPTCKTCKGMGYRGRRAISEAMYFSREIRHMIVEADQRIDEDGLREQASKQGMLTLQDSAREVVKMGETSVDEMMRVTMTEE